MHMPVVPQEVVEMSPARRDKKQRLEVEIHLLDKRPPIEIEISRPTTG